MPGVVAIEHVLARTDTAAVCLTHLAAYPTGFDVEIVAMAADQRMLDPLTIGGFARLGRGALPDTMLRIGVQLADGTKATNTGGPHPTPGGAPG